MATHVRFILLAALTVPGTTAWGQERPSKTLPSFRSERELAAFLHQAIDQRKQPPRRAPGGCARPITKAEPREP